MLTRRIFLRDSALAMVGVGVVPGWLARAVYAAPSSGRKKTLVAIFQRGAADGLNILVPFGEKRYYELRPSIAVPNPSANNEKEDRAIDLDGFFGLNPALAPLKALYDARTMAIVQAAGSPDPTRSHFDAQDFMEAGTPGVKSTRDGWMNRALRPEAGKSSSLRALALGPALPRSLRGRNAAIAVNTLREFQVHDAMASGTFETMYMKSPDTVLHGAGRDTFEAVKLVKSIQQRPYTPENGATYSNGRFGESLRQIAQLIKADVGVEVAFADIGGWDHHVQEVGQRASQGALPNLLREYGGSLAAFCQDLGDRLADVAVVTMSEFGRTVHENGNRGTDHGHGNVMFVMGGGVQGGKIYGQWPGLEREQLWEGRDLNLTSDFRDVLAELVQTHLGNQKLDAVFPGYAASPEKFRGLLRG